MILLSTSNSYAQSDVCNSDVPITVRNPTNVAVRTAVLDPKQLAGITLLFYLKSLPNQPIGSYFTAAANLPSGGPSCLLVPVDASKVPNLKRDGTEYLIDARLDANISGNNSPQWRAINSFFLNDTMPLPVPTDVRIIP